MVFEGISRGSLKGSSVGSCKGSFEVLVRVQREIWGVCGPANCERVIEYCSAV